MVILVVYLVHTKLKAAKYKQNISKTYHFFFLAAVDGCLTFDSRSGSLPELLCVCFASLRKAAPCLAHSVPKPVKQKTVRKCLHGFLLCFSAGDRTLKKAKARAMIKADN